MLLLLLLLLLLVCCWRWLLEGWVWLGVIRLRRVSRRNLLLLLIARRRRLARVSAAWRLVRLLKRRVRLLKGRAAAHGSSSEKQFAAAV